MSIFLVVATTAIVTSTALVDIKVYNEPSMETCAGDSARVVKDWTSPGGIYAYCLDYTGKNLAAAPVLRVVAWQNPDNSIRAVQARHSSTEECQASGQMMLKNRTVYEPPGANNTTGNIRTTVVTGPRCRQRMWLELAWRDLR